MKYGAEFGFFVGAASVLQLSTVAYDAKVGFVVVAVMK